MTKSFRQVTAEHGNCDNKTYNKFEKKRKVNKKPKCKKVPIKILYNYNKPQGRSGSLVTQSGSLVTGPGLVGKRYAARKI